MLLCFSSPPENTVSYIDTHSYFVGRLATVENSLSTSIMGAAIAILGGLLFRMLKDPDLVNGKKEGRTLNFYTANMERRQLGIK